MRKLIKNYCYFADSDGYIVNSAGKTLQVKEKKGQMVVRLSVDGKPVDRSIARLILETFEPIGDSQNYKVERRDGDKNNNSLNNLYWSPRVKINVMLDGEVMSAYRAATMLELLAGGSFKYYYKTIRKMKESHTFKNKYEVKKV